MRRLKKMADINQIFLSSLDHPEDWEIKNYTIREDMEVDTIINHHKFSDGAPVLKYFVRNPEDHTIYFKIGDQISVVVNNEDEEVYIYADGAWNKILNWHEYFFL